MRKPTGKPAYGKENRFPQNKTKSCLKKPTLISLCRQTAVLPSPDRFRLMIVGKLQFLLPESARLSHSILQTVSDCRFKKNKKIFEEICKKLFTNPFHCVIMYSVSVYA